MRLAHKDFRFVIRIDENLFPVLVLERADLFRKYISELCRQCEGDRGGFVLSENYEPVDLAKAGIVLTDWFNMEINGRKQMSALQKRLNSIALSAQFQQETNEIKRLVFKWILHLEEEIPFPLQHDEIQVSDVLKSSALRFEDNNEELLKTAETYIKICADLLKTKLIICVGIHNCFSMKEIDMLYRTAEYENISILDIERYEPDQYHPLEKSYIIDNDFCEIYNES